MVPFVFQEVKTSQSIIIIAGSTKWKVAIPQVQIHCARTEGEFLFKLNAKRWMHHVNDNITCASETAHERLFHQAKMFSQMMTFLYIIYQWSHQRTDCWCNQDEKQFATATRTSVVCRYSGQCKWLLFFIENCDISVWSVFVISTFTCVYSRLRI